MISAVVLALSSLLPAALFAGTGNESGPLDHLDGYNGITVTVAAGAAELSAVIPARNSTTAS